MTFPIWQPDFPVAWLIAIVATVHVAIAQFAVGGGFFLAFAETRAHRQDDVAILDWLKGYTRVFAFVSLVFGTVTGVGIWFTIGLISPEGTQDLIRVFVWMWAVEWVLFLVEILSLVVYLKTWNRVSRRAHRALAWTYALSAWLSLVAIGGILSFQLTPGRWLETGGFWSAYLNPGLLPTVGARTGLSLLLGGLGALLYGAFSRDRLLRAEVGRLAGYWTALSVPAALGGFIWYALSLPADVTAGLTKMPGVRHAAAAAGLCVVVAGLGALFATVRRGRLYMRSATLALVVLALAGVGATEFVREGLRKPFLIRGYLYANHVPVSAYPGVQERGFASLGLGGVKGKGAAPVEGQALFAAACGPCHGVVEGPRPLAPFLRGLDEAFVTNLILRSDQMRAPMPPFPGNRDDARLLASHLLGLASKVPPLATGQVVWTRRCGPCHTLHGPHRPLIGVIRGQNAEDLEGVIAMVGDMSEKMPPWTGSDVEKKALAGYLAEVGAKP